MVQQLYVPQASDWIGALEAGQKARMVDTKQKLGRQIGGLMASGDYKGAANAAYSNGELDTGVALTKTGAAQAEQGRRQGYGAKYAAGQGKEAVQSAYAGGDFEIGKDLQTQIDHASEQQLKDAHEKATYLAEVLAPIGEIPETDMAARKAAIQAHKADLVAHGIYTAEQIDSFEPTTSNLGIIFSHAIGTKDYLERNKGVVVGQNLINPNTGKTMYEGPRYEKVGQSEQLLQVGGSGAGSPAPAQGAPQAAAGSAGQGGFDSVYHGFVAPHEGGYTPSDGNGAPANFGINQKANPEVDVKSLTPESAKQILHDKYWVPSGADKLPPALQAVHFDTAVNMGVGAANNLLNQAGGDPQKYLQLREQRYRAIAAADPSKASKLPVWLDRNQDLAAYLGGQGAATAAPQGQQAVQGGPSVRVIAQGAPKPQARPATAEEKQLYGVAADVPAQVTPDGQFHVISGVAAGMKRVPAQVQQGYAGNSKSVQQIDAAIAAIRQNPHAMGLKNMMGDNINQRIDPGGVSTRAAVTNIGSLILHDRSGAAVTAAEQPRLMPFIPQATDTPEAAIKKLEGLREQYVNANSQIEVQFGEDSGYTPIGGAKPAAHAPAAKAPAAPAKPGAPKVGDVMKGYRFNGGNPADQKSWSPA